MYEVKLKNKKGIENGFPQIAMIEKQSDPEFAWRS